MSSRGTAARKERRPVFKGVQSILCAIYVRLSREDEDKHQAESESIQNQKSLLTADAAGQGWEV